MKDVLKVFNLTSNECYIKDDKHVLKGVSFTLDEHDSLGLISSTADESKILLEALANLREIYNGYILFQNSTTAKKTRLALDHIFFLDSTSSLINTMTVLEYLMHLTGKFKVKDLKRQKVIFNMLLDYGLKNICLSQISILTKEERMLVCLFASMFSNSQFVIVNLNSYDFSDAQISVLQKISARLVQDKTIILSTTQAKLIGVCCNKILFVKDGTQKYFGTTLEMQQDYDNVMFILRDKHLDALYENVRMAFPYLDVRKEHNMVLVCAVDGKYISNTTFYQTLAINNIFPGEVKINLGRISNAIEELVRSDEVLYNEEINYNQNDLQQ